jgi:hypothetical protein
MPSPTPSPSPTRPPTPASYEAESSANTLAGSRVMSCSGCSGGKKVGDIGRGMGTLQFNSVTASASGTASLTIVYVNGGTTRTAQLSVDGGAAVTITFRGTRDWSTPGTVVVNVTLKSGVNTLKFFNTSSAAPDFDKITVGGVGSKAGSVGVI